MFSLFPLAAVAIIYAAAFGGTVSAQFPLLPRIPDPYVPRLPVFPGLPPRDCESILRTSNSLTEDRAYDVYPERDTTQPISVRCDSRGYTEILNRFDGSTDFNLRWEQMKNQIGSITGEFWVGLEAVHRFTRTGAYSVLIEIGDGTSRWQENYDFIDLWPESLNYTLRVRGFNEAESTTGNPALGDLDGFPFTAWNKDNDAHPRKNCAAEVQSPGWFHRSCRSNVLLFASYWRPRRTWSMRWKINGNFTFIKELSIKIKRRS